MHICLYLYVYIYIYIGSARIHPAASWMLPRAMGPAAPGSSLAVHGSLRLGGPSPSPVACL